MIAYGQDQGVRTVQSAPQEFSQTHTDVRSVITLDPPTGWDLQVHAFDAQGNRLPEAPANYQRLGEAKVGEPSTVRTLTVRFSEADTLLQIKSTADFPIEPGGSCLEGNVYAANTTCTLLVRFTPQGAGHRLGFVSIVHSASATPAVVGLTGNGYTPVVSFTPSQITTVPGTVSAGTGTISSATSIAVDGGDIVYIADTGNSLVKEVDSSGTIGTTALTPIATPVSIAVDSFGIIYTTNTGSVYYFSTYFPWGSQTAYGYAYAAGTCTPSAPCAFSAVGMSSPADLSIDPNDNLFFEEGTKGAAEMPVASIAGGSGSFNLWYLSDQFAYSSGTAASFAVDANDNLYTKYSFSSAGACFLLEEPLYNAEYAPVAHRVAGGVKCGFSGDGGQARGAEISSTIGQIAFDIAGNLYFADAGNQRVRRIDALTGIIRTIAGNGTAGYKGDGGLATTAELDAPTGVGVDSQGQVYILSNSATTGTAQVVRKVGTTGALAFPATKSGTASGTQLINVANTGNTSLSFVHTSFTGADPADFSIDANTTSCNFAAGNFLNAGQSCQIGIIFKPGAVGPRSATLNLVDNTVNGVNIVKLSGPGSAAAVVKFTAPSTAQVITPGSKISVAVTVTSSNGPAPTGKVNFSVDGKLAASGTIAADKASVEIGGVAAGTHTLVASYPGDKDHIAAKATETIKVSN